MIQGLEKLEESVVGVAVETIGQEEEEEVLIWSRSWRTSSTEGDAWFKDSTVFDTCIVGELEEVSHRNARIQQAVKGNGMRGKR